MSVATGSSRSSRRLSVFAFAVIASGSVLFGTRSPVARADNWPAFRGVDGRSITTDKGLPVEWGPDKNVRWRVDLPGRSNGSPIVWGDRVFLLQAVEKDKRRTLMCFDRANGKPLWQSGVTYADSESTHPDNPYCSGTPATDGERVVASFGSAGLYCYDFAGKELWHRDLGKLNHMFGNAISPVIVGDRVVVNFGPGEGARLVALDKRTGAVAWEAQAPKVDPSEQTLTGAKLSGPAAMVVMPMMAQGDKNDDAGLSREEMVALAGTWFDKLDPQKTGKVTKEQFVERVGDVLPPPPGAPGGGSFKPGPIVGPGLFGAADADQNGSLTRDELAKTLGGWYAKWSGGKNDPLDANQILDGLSTILPPPPGSGAGAAAGFGGANGPGGSWCTPVVVRAGGRDELVVALPNRLAAYDPKNGTLLWFSKGLADSVQPMPVWAEKEGVILASGGDMAGGSMIAVRPGGAGDVTDSRRLWRQTRMKGSIGTGVAHDGRYYSLSSDGFAGCMDVKTGRRLWQKRLEGAGEKNSSWSSMLLAGGKIYVPNQAGEVFVLEASPQFKVLATNSVNEPTNASLAASDGQLFLRTDKALWCIAAAK
jgi:outer membrane protein assembly factor BamB